MDPTGQPSAQNPYPRMTPRGVSMDSLSVAWKMVSGNWLAFGVAGLIAFIPPLIVGIINNMMSMAAMNAATSSGVRLR